MSNLFPTYNVSRYRELKNKGCTGDASVGLWRGAPAGHLRGSVGQLAARYTCRASGALHSALVETSAVQE
jgi:hypothetical protein